MQRLHRNNAAEWIMWGAMIVISPALIAIDRWKHRKQRKRGSSHG